MRSRRTSIVAALAGLTAMLFLQAALAFAPCETPARVAGASADAMQMHDAGMPDCIEMQTAKLCPDRWDSQDEAVGKAPSYIADLPVLRVPFVPAFPRPAARARAVVPATSPPRILFQSFLL